MNGTAALGCGFERLSVGLGTRDALVRQQRPTTTSDPREIVGPDYPLAPLEAGPRELAELIGDFADPQARRAAVESAAPHLAKFNWVTAARRRALRKNP